MDGMPGGTCPRPARRWVSSAGRFARGGLGARAAVARSGRLRNNNYEKDGEEVYALAFTAEEVDYLDSRADSEARRARMDGASAPQSQPANAAPKANGRARRARTAPQGEAVPA